jgi:hypothetical protein
MQPPLNFGSYNLEENRLAKSAGGAFSGFSKQSTPAPAVKIPSPSSLVRTSSHRRYSGPLIEFIFSSLDPNGGVGLLSPGFFCRHFSILFLISRFDQGRDI